MSRETLLQMIKARQQRHLNEKTARAREWLRDRGRLWSDQPVKRRGPTEAQIAGAMRAVEAHATSVSRPVYCTVEVLDEGTR